MAALIAAAGDNPARITSEAAFAALCGASTVDCSSGKQQRHRLNRGGDRQANSALWRIAVTRIRCDPRHPGLLARRTAEGKTRKEIIRDAQALHRPPGLPTAHPPRSQPRTRGGSIIPRNPLT